MASNHTDTQNIQSEEDEPAKCRQDYAPDSSNKSWTGTGCDSSDAIRQSVVKQYNYPSNMTGIIHNANIHTHYNVHIHIYTDRGYFCGNIGK